MGEPFQKEVTYMNHKFEIVTFLEPVTCKVCSKFIWGLIKQGYNCTVCKNCPTHKQCAAHIEFRCINSEKDHPLLSFSSKSLKNLLDKKLSSPKSTFKISKINFFDQHKDSVSDLISTKEEDLFGEPINKTTWTERKQKILSAKLEDLTPFSLNPDSEEKKQQKFKKSPRISPRNNNNNSKSESNQNQKKNIPDKNVSPSLFSSGLYVSKPSLINPYSIEYDSNDLENQKEEYQIPSSKRNWFESSQVFTEVHEKKYPMLFGFEDSEIFPFLEKVQKGDWNSQFQNSVEFLKIVTLNLNSPILHKVTAAFSLINLARDFVFTAHQVGRLIISEYELPVEKKTIKPKTNIGGVAGGQKYIHHNILFKFALDTNGIYGSDYAACKVADHELKGASYLFNLITSENNIHAYTPLTCIIEYMGFKLIASSIIPTEKLIYGTANAGKIVFKEIEKFNLEMEKIGKTLGLRKHIVGTTQESLKELDCVGDLEGHLGKDGRFYLLDFSRLFPPQQPMLHKESCSHLYHLLRPEFVQLYSQKKPLCSDSFSGFIRFDPKKKEYNHDIREATEYLLDIIIPSVSKGLEDLMLRAIDEGIVLEINVKKFLHSRGVNLRMLGYIRRETKDLRVSVMLLVEMFSRVIKNEINRQLRTRAQLLKNFTQEPYRRLIANILNQVFGKENYQFWEYLKDSALPQQFPHALHPQEEELSGYQIAHLLFLISIHRPPFLNIYSPNSNNKNSESHKKLSQSRSSNLQNLDSQNTEKNNFEKNYPPSISLIMNSLWHTLLTHSKIARELSQVIVLKVAIPQKNRPEEYTIDTQNLKVSLGSPIQGNPEVVITIPFHNLVFFISNDIWIREKLDLTDLEQNYSVEISGNRKSAIFFIFKILPIVIQPPRFFSENNFLIDGRFWLLTNLQEKLGITFQNQIPISEYRYSRFRERISKSNIPFTSLDLASIDGRIKSMNILSYAEGILHECLAGSSFENNRVQLELAIGKYEECLKTQPNNPIALGGTARCLRLLTPHLPEEEGLRRLKLCIHYLKRLIQLDPKNCASAWFEAACIQKFSPEQREEYFIRSLEKFPFYEKAIRQYITFHLQQGKSCQEWSQRLKQVEGYLNLKSNQDFEIYGDFGEDERETIVTQEIESDTLDLLDSQIIYEDAYEEDNYEQVDTKPFNYQIPEE